MITALELASLCRSATIGDACQSKKAKNRPPIIKLDKT